MLVRSSAARQNSRTSALSTCSWVSKLLAAGAPPRARPTAAAEWQRRQCLAKNSSAWAQLGGCSGVGQARRVWVASNEQAPLPRAAQSNPLQRKFGA
jgi:hypothetical protein